MNSNLNPNRLEGHEGKMLTALCDIYAYTDCLVGLEEWEKWKAPGTPTGWDGHHTIQRGSVVLFIACGYDPADEDRYGWIDVLHQEKVCRIFYSLHQWMRLFKPWPSWNYFIQNNEAEHLT